MVHLRVDRIVGGYSRGQERAQRPDKQGGLFRPWKGGVGIVVKDTYHATRRWADGQEHMDSIGIWLRQNRRRLSLKKEGVRT